MTLSKSEASAALADIDASSDRSRRLAGYARTGPHLIWWGALWSAGYATQFVEPGWVNIIWPTIGIVGFIGSIVIARGASGQADWRIGAAVWVLLLFMVALFSVFGPPRPEQIAATWGLVIATIYILCGLFLGPRLVVAGSCLAIATLVGFFAMGSYFILWMSLIAGGSLILAGVWLRRV